MDDKVDLLIPALMQEMQSDGENESKELLRYYTGCNSQERAVINNVMIYLCGWSFETLLEKCGLRVKENGEVVC
jgi:hypothetical protein